MDLQSQVRKTFRCVVPAAVLILCGVAGGRMMSTDTAFAEIRKNEPRAAFLSGGEVSHNRIRSNCFSNEAVRFA